MNIIVKDSKYRHGNCVPFIVQNTKNNTIIYKGSLNEVAKKLKISQAYASNLHRNEKQYKDVYTIKRVGFSQAVNFS